MASTNEHTGDSLVSKHTTNEYRENYDKIFNKPVKEEKTTKKEGEKECLKGE